MKRYADQNRGEVPEYKVGQKVWIEAEELDLKRPSKKLAEKRLGPYPIVEIVSPNAIKVKLPRSIKIHPVINVSRLRPYAEPTIPGQATSEPPPVEINGELEYEVEQILDSRIYRNRFQYLVKWKGYTEEHNTWEPIDNVTNAQAAIDEFHRTHPSAPRRLRSLEFFRFRPIENFTEIADKTICRIDHESGVSI
jgi:hypothetical protein